MRYITKNNIRKVIWHKMQKSKIRYEEKGKQIWENAKEESPSLSCFRMLWNNSGSRGGWNRESRWGRVFESKKSPNLENQKNNLKYSNKIRATLPGHALVDREWRGEEREGETVYAEGKKNTNPWRWGESWTRARVRVSIFWYHSWEKGEEGIKS